MDILHLVDRLEELFNQSRPIPLTRSVIVDEDRFLEIIDQMRISIPEEVKKAQSLETQKDRILAQAQEEASRTIALAQQKGDDLLTRDTIVMAGQTRAEQIIEQARVDATVMRGDADMYVVDVLESLENELSRLLNQARNGISKLRADQHSMLEEAEKAEVVEESELPAE
jgi:cell division septum initiation protein DivIVA